MKSTWNLGRVIPSSIGNTDDTCSPDKRTHLSPVKRKTANHKKGEQGT